MFFPCSHLYAKASELPDAPDVFFAIARYLPNNTLGHTKEIYKDGWVTVGQLYGVADLVGNNPRVRAEIDCAGDLDHICEYEGCRNSVLEGFATVGDIKTINLMSKGGWFTSRMDVKRLEDTHDDKVFSVDLYTVAPH